MQAYTRQKLIEDGVREDSVFFEYIGRMRDLSDLAESVLNKSTGRKSFELKSKTIFDLVLDIMDIRETHYRFLEKKHAPLDIPEIHIDGNLYVDTVKKLDKEIEDGLNELEFSLNNNRDIDAMRVFDQLKIKLQTLKGKEQDLYESANTRINRIFNTTPSATPPTHQGSSAINNRYSQPAQNIYYSGTRPSQGVPDHRTAYVQRLQPIHTVTPQPVEPQYNYHVNMQPPQPMPARKPPVMHQVGPKPTPVRQRKKEKENNKNNQKQNREKKHTLRNVMLLISVLGIAYLNAPGKSVDVPAPTMPSNEPGIELKVPMPSKEEIPISLPSEVTVTFETPEDKPIVVATPAPVQTQEARPKYDKHSLMYCLEFMDDEMVSVVADSLRNSIDDFSSLNMGMYGNGCNMTFSSDREYVAHVFSILDSRAASMRYSSNYDKFAIAPQMEQLSGDVSKYLIAKAIGESGKYDKDQYEISDIDYYYTILYGQTDAFDARTVTIENGKLVEDELVGRSVHFKGDIKTLINSNCALDAAIDGGHKDKGTGRNTQCAFGTQEGDVIDSNSLKAYDTLINIFSNEYELKVPNKGKGVKIVYDKEYDR